MESLTKTANQVWILSGVAAAVYILNTQILQPVSCFNLVFSGNGKIATTVVFLALCIHFTYEYWKILKSRINKNFSEENCKEKSNFNALKSGKSGDGKCSLQSLSEFSNVYWKSHKRSFSFPMPSQQEFWYNLANAPDRKNLTFRDLFKMEKENILQKDSVNTHRKGSEEIPVALHKLVKEIDLVLEQVKSLNHAFEKCNNDFYTDIQNTNTLPTRLNLGEEHVVNDWKCEPQSLPDFPRVIDSPDAVSCSTSKQPSDLITADNSSTVSKNGSSSQAPHDLKMNEFRILKKKYRKINSCHQQIFQDARDKVYPKCFTTPEENTKIKSDSDRPMLYSAILKPKPYLLQVNENAKFYETKTCSVECRAPKSMKLARVPMRPHSLISSRLRHYSPNSVKECYPLRISNKMAGLSEDFAVASNVAPVFPKTVMSPRNVPKTTKDVAVSKDTRIISKDVDVSNKDVRIISKDKCILKATPIAS